MKKIISIFLTLIVLLGLVGCGEIEGGIEGVYKYKDGSEGYYQFYKNGNCLRDLEMFKEDSQLHKEMHEEIDISKGKYSVKDNIITIQYDDGEESFLYIVGDYICQTPFEGTLKVEHEMLSGKVEWKKETLEYYANLDYEFLADMIVKRDYITDIGGEGEKELHVTETYSYDPKTGIICRKTDSYTGYSMFSNEVFYEAVLQKVEE